MGGGILYATNGAGTWRGSGGTITTFGPAEPHCPVCGMDFVTEHFNEKYGYLSVCLHCLADHIGDQPYLIRDKAKRLTKALHPGKGKLGSARSHYPWLVATAMAASTALQALIHHMGWLR